MKQTFLIEMETPNHVGEITAETFKEFLEAHNDLNCSFTVKECLPVAVRPK